VSSAESLYGQEHVRRYRETDGAVGHIWRRGAKVLLLTTTERTTGKLRTTPLIYENAGDDYQTRTDRRIETDADVDDVIALLRVNYDRVVGRHGLPTAA
jgi:hypothetical protein